MIYITVEEGNVVGLIHRFPFDEIEGLGKTEEELLTTGKLVESVPNLTYVEGKSGVYKYNPDTNSVYVDYTDAPPRPLSTQEEIQILKEQNAQMLFALVQGGLM